MPRNGSIFFLTKLHKNTFGTSCSKSLSNSIFYTFFLEYSFLLIDKMLTKKHYSGRFSIKIKPFRNKNNFDKTHFLTTPIWWQSVLFSSMTRIIVDWFHVLSSKIGWWKQEKAEFETAVVMLGNRNHLVEIMKIIFCDLPT